MTTRTGETKRDGVEGRPRHSGGRRAGTVLGRTKRAVSVVLGSVLLVRGLKRRSLRGAATALVGAWLLSRALRGNSGMGQPLDEPLVDRSRGDRTEAVRGTEISRTTTVGKPASELYETWRDPEQFSRIMGHFAEITSRDRERLHWTVHGPLGRDVSWETRFVADEPGELLRWETQGRSLLSNEGSVRFRPASGGRGTVVTLSVSFDAPGGTLGDAALKRLDVVPETLAGEALHRFKSLAESGEIPTLEGNPSARGRGDLL